LDFPPNGREVTAIHLTKHKYKTQLATVQMGSQLAGKHAARNCPNGIAAGWRPHTDSKMIVQEITPLICYISG